MVRDEHMPISAQSISAQWDGWLGSLVGALDAMEAGEGLGEGLGRCAPVSCPQARYAVLAHLSRPAGSSRVAGLPTVYSPAICNLGRLRRSIPRSLASSCMM